MAAASSANDEVNAAVTPVEEYWIGGLTQVKITPAPPSLLPVVAEPEVKTVSWPARRQMV